MFFARTKQSLPTPEDALQGRDTEIRVPSSHYVLDAPLKPPFPDHLEQIVVGMGCFWGAERIFWQAPGVYTTAVGYAGGVTKNPTYEETCSGRTGHTEVVLVVFDPAVVSREEILRLFWEGHNPTQGMRQGNDVGTQYRSAIFPQTDDQRAAAERVVARVGASDRWTRPITTSIEPPGAWYTAEAYHQDYLRKHPGGYTCHYLRD
jgi:peptide-methionine (S)-S-oxide reductase